MRTYKNTRNPILPLDIHIPDGEAHVMPDGRLYVYGSYDTMEDGYCSDQYRVVSTGDLEEWTIHEISFEGSQVSWFLDESAPKYPGIDWEHPTPFLGKIIADSRKQEELAETNSGKEAEPKAILYAPDAVYKDGKYYLYFCMEDDSEGVAISDHPQGPFGQPVQMPCGGIDPAVFLDEDGQVYYYWGQLSAKGVKLNPDMATFTPDAVVSGLLTEETHYFHEGSSIRKIGDTYYMVYSDMERGKPTALGYATGKSPFGPFTYRGIIVDNDGCDPASWNNHGSIEKVNGKWYVFYHRSSRNSRIHRRLCMEPITILPDGSIPEVKPTSQGVGEPFAPGERMFGYQACQLSGDVYIDVDGNGSEWLCSISRGDTAIFRYVKKETGFCRALVEAEGSGMIELFLDDVLAGSVQIEDGICRGGILTDSGFGKRELKLSFTQTENLKVISLVLW